MFKTTVLVTALLGMCLILSSCFVDYGLDSENYDIVATSYNSEYNFSQVTRFAIIDSIVHFGEDGVNHAYDGQIISKLSEELTALGWQQVNDSAADVTIMMGTTSATTVVYGNSSWWDYYSWYPGWSYYPSYGSGYSWYYPYYSTGYEYGYTYETGTLFISMVDLRLGAENKLPVQWIAVLNGLMNATDVSARLNSGINQAFIQSPYLN